MADQREQIKLLNYMGRFPNGITSNELAAKMKMPLTRVRRLIQSLRKEGFMVDTGRKEVIGKPPFARPATVWTTIRIAQQKTAAPEGTAEEPGNGATSGSFTRSGQESNNGPGPQEARQGEHLICPQEFSGGQ